MPNLFQFEMISKQLKIYVLGILLSTKKKNCSAISRDINISKKQLYEVYKNTEDKAKSIKNILMKKAKNHQKKSLPSVLIIDPTIIRKWFAKELEGLSYDYDGVINKSKKCLEPVVAAWTNSKITIPLDFSFWINRRFIEKYKKKTEIAEELIIKICALMQIDYVVLDGAFATKKMIRFFKESDINFCMRIARNRLIKSQKGTIEQLQKHPELKFKRNECHKTIKGFYKGMECFFTAHKRYSKKRNSFDIVYIVSSLDISPREQAAAYGIRWNIEKMFRTMKQSLGLSDCQCIGIEKQQIHIYSVFLAYAKLEEEKIFKRKKSPEEILNPIRSQKTYLKQFESYLGMQTIMS